MKLIVGQDRGSTDWTIRDLDLQPAGPEDGEPLIWWPAEYWPEVKALVEFDVERKRLGLPTLEDAEWH